MSAIVDGFFNFFKHIETPNSKDVASEAKSLKVQMKKANVNTIPVRYFFKNTPYFMDTIATLYRTTNFTIGMMEIPEPLGFILADDSIFFNKVDKKEIIHVKEGYPFSINLSAELSREFDDFKKAHPEVPGTAYTVPLMINQIPMKIIRIKLGHVLPGFPDEIDITQKVIHQLGFSKILDKVNKQKIQGAFMLVVMGFLAGALFGLGLGIFFTR
jgi:hypothetical protein